MDERPATKAKWYVSYAWGENRTAEGPASDNVVDKICAAAKGRGREILRDKEVLSLGESISDFMRKIGAGARSDLCAGLSAAGPPADEIVAAVTTPQGCRDLGF